MAETTARAAAVGVLCGVRGGGEVLVVRALDDGPGLRVTRRCADLAELQAAAEAGLGRVAVLSADLDQLDLTAVATLRATGVAVVVLLDPERTTAAERARVAGADLVLEAPTEPRGCGHAGRPRRGARDDGRVRARRASAGARLGRR
ncbi:MAG: hypothetical protein NVV70_07475 [Cellulomonas sp.]|nr:hypothetical protein [Cellulomonas sp.]MCR6647969.1 hypothetical protein [Cellulomonas sp.]